MQSSESNAMAMMGGSHNSNYAQVFDESKDIEKGEVTPHEKISLSWRNITYKIQLPERKEDQLHHKVVLNNLGGEALSGEVMAIMGTSGAGKSTLLDVLAGRLNSKDLSGEILLNGSPIDKRTFRKESGYVRQSDALYPLLTVRETLRFAAYLRVQGKTRQEQQEVAENMISLLRLQSCADTIIGNDQIRGLSGGEKRRVSIAVDIIHQPRVIFLDEPTSGLDSSTAFAVVESLRQLAIVKNRIIVMTIHQPSSRLFELMDKALFLSFGRITYIGHADKLQALTLDTYADLGLGDPPQANPPELFLDLCDKLQASGNMHILFSKHEFNAEIRKVPLQADTPVSPTTVQPTDASYANSILGDVWILCERSLINILRTKELFLARFGSSMFFAILGGTLFLFPGDDDDGVYHKASFLFLTLAYSYYTSLEALPIFYQEREIFQREYSGGAYRAISYTISSSVVYYPFLFMIALSYMAVSWWLVNLPNVAEIFLFQVFILFVVLVVGSTFATTLSVLLPDPMTAQTVGSAILSVMLVFSGFFITRALIPSYWIYFHYMSFFKFALDSELINALENYANTPTKNNDQVLQEFSVDGMSKWQGVGILLCWAVVYRSIFYYRLVTAFNGSRKT